MKVTVKIKAGDRKKLPTSLTKEDIQKAVCDGIIEADVKKAEVEKERIKNAKLSVWSITTIVFLGLVMTAFALLSIAMFFNQELEIMERLTGGAKLALIALTYGFVIIAEYAVGKNKSQSFVFNIVTILLTLVTLVITIIQ